MDDVLDDLKMATLVSFGARNGRWFVGIGCRIGSFDVILGYRHLDWESGSTGALGDLEVNGPVLGARFVF